MTRTGNLFTKMFLGFWGASIAILATWMIAAHYFDSLPRVAPEHGRRGGPTKFMLQLHYSLQNLPLPELSDFLNRHERRHGVEVWLLDADGSDLFDRPVPPVAARLAAKLHGPRKRVTGPGGNGPLIAFRLYRPDTGRVKAVVELPHRSPHLVRALGDNPGLRLVLAILVSGLICYLLSRLITRRIRQLRDAAQQLAAGDLSARITVPTRGGDETDELAREFNAMAARLEERITVQKQLLRDVSHELRSPLARLRIALALAQTDTANRDRHLARIGRDSSRLEVLIDQLLAAEQAEFDPDSTVDLVQLLTALCEDAAYEASASRGRVTLDAHAPSAMVTGSAGSLTMCFNNILRNALAHNPPGEAVTVSLQSDADRVTVCVADRGPGVSEQDLERIFDAFYRVDEARSRARGGHGLGLAIVKRIVTDHGGEVTARNREPGLEVRVTLPAA